MTAEIALLNKLAVTLAADSAVTLNVGGSQKVYNSADKIFEITNHDPIGLMVYNNPELHGIPIESIAKMYRDRTCQRHYPTVFAFAEAFLKHVEGIYAPDPTVSDNIYLSLWPKLLAMRNLHSEASSHVIDSLAALPDEEKTGDRILSRLEDAYLAAFDSERVTLQNLPDQPWAEHLTVQDVLTAHASTIDATIKGAFQETRLSDDSILILSEVGALSLLKQYQPERLTGLVFAGYGEDEIFPSLVAYEVYGTVAGRLKFIETTRFDVDRTLTPVAAVIPFAQQEMVDRFIYGMDNQFLQLCTSFFAGALASLETQLSVALEGFEETAADALRVSLAEAARAIMSEFDGQLVPDHLKASRAQLSDIIRSMPKQELAALSESLVHITSLKRKFSADAESVGGPIDVAMITRAEGFVWVRRKHFFDAALNPRYFHRRYAKPVPSPAPEGQQDQ